MKPSVLVTGVSGGIGRAIALRFAEEGFTVVGTYNRGKDRAYQLALSLRSLGKDIMLFHLDVTKPDSINKLVDNIEAMLGSLNVLVNNAGILQTRGILETDLDEWERTIKTNLTGVFLLTKQVLPLMMRAEWASIVNIASIAGETGNVLAGIAYSASKAGLIGFTKRLAVELAPYGIRVNAVAPSFVETDMVAEYLDSEEKREKIKRLHPLNMIIKPEDVAEAVLFLALPDRSRAITGHILRVNAGRYT